MDGGSYLPFWSSDAKYATLKCIAGIERPDEGRIVAEWTGTLIWQRINGHRRNESRIYVSRITHCFCNECEYRIFQAGDGEEAGSEKSREYILISAWQTGTHHMPDQLSGGQKQRVIHGSYATAAEPEYCFWMNRFTLDGYLKWKMEQQMLELLQSTNYQYCCTSHSRDVKSIDCVMQSALYSSGADGVIEPIKNFPGIRRRRRRHFIRM